MSLIQMKGVSKVYNTGKVKVEALRGIDLVVEPNELIAIVGPSGSGKSTLMNILGCLDTATSGSYRLGGTYSILIRHPWGTTLHHASAAIRENMFESVRADVVLLGIAGRQDTEEYLHQVVDAVGARRVIPIHFDDFFSPVDEPLEPIFRVNLNEFFRTAEAHRPRLDVETLPRGEPVGRGEPHGRGR